MTLPKWAIGILAGFGMFMLLIVSGSIFVVDQIHQAIVLQFGELQRVIKDPGLYGRVPLIQEIVMYDKRVLDADLPPFRVTAGDQKRLEVDTYTRYQIEDPIQFYKSVSPANEQGARARLQGFVGSSLRTVLGRVPLQNLLTQEREKVMHDIQGEVANFAKPLGIKIVDVRIIRADLPADNHKAVFARMNSDLERIAKETRSKGEQDALVTKANANFEKTKLLAEAQKKSAEIRGKGEAEAIRLLTDAYSKDPKIFEFFKAMEAYPEALSSQTTTIVVGTGNRFLKNMQDPVVK